MSYFLRFDFPEMKMNCSHDELNSTSILMKWDNMYPECFNNFSLLVNGTVMGTTNGINYTIAGLNVEYTYNVCVVARDNSGNTESDWMDCANITLKERKPCGMYGIVEIDDQ